MEQTTPTPRPRSIRWRQILAAILLCSPFFLSQIFSFFGSSLYETGMTAETIGLLSSILHTTPPIVAFILLAGIAANRVTRTSLGMIIGWFLIVFILNALMHLDILPATAGYFFSLLDSLIFIYFFSLLLRNNEIAESRRKWIILLPVGQLFGVVQVCTALAQNAIPEGFEFSYQHLFLFSSGWNWFMYIFRVLLWIAWFKLTHSEAFAPTYDDTPAPAGAYSPATKYMAMPIICGLLCFALSWTLYHFANHLV